MTGPAVGEPDPGRAAPSRTGPWDAAGSVLVLLVLGLAFRLIIAYLLPGSGFGVDLASFRYWAENLAGQGLYGFYDRPFFHDYTPGYLYVLWAVGEAAKLFGGGTVGDLIKIPPILADIVLAGLVWSMARELGASERAARLGAFMVVVNPVSWFDSAIWGQVDSVGVVVLLLALRELWRDRPERAAVLAMLAALVKPQLGILVPIVAVVVIRRALWPGGGYGDDPAPAPGRSTTAFERTVRGPIRIVTTALAGLVTAIVVSLPFGLSLHGLIEQVFKTAAGYPYLTVNAYNPWSLVGQAGNGLALSGTWICDSTVQPSGPFELRLPLTDWVVWSSPGTTVSCPDGFMIGAFPAVIVGALLFLVAAALTIALVARRPDRRTMLVAVAVLALAFFILPTRVHERYLYPLVGVGAILAAVSLRWRLAYVISAAATFANMYAILTLPFYQNPGISDWLGIGGALTSYWGVAIAALAQTGVFAFGVSELRDDALDRLGEEIDATHEPDLAAVAWQPAGAFAVAGGAAVRPLGRLDRLAPTGPRAPPAAPVRLAALDRHGDAQARIDPVSAGRAGVIVPSWEDRNGAAPVGPLEWFRARFNDRPIRADRSRVLDAEPGGRLDRLDLWLVAVLVISLLTVRLWRLSEPYGMHFDEVYHARTATEFLQDWRYGISHDIYEWTHPHVAKYAMAIGIMAWGEDQTVATTELGTPVADAVIEPRWDPGTDGHAITGDRLWVATGAVVRAYDLATRQLVASLPVPGASSLALDRAGQRVFVGTNEGEIRLIDTTGLDAARVSGGSASFEATSFMNLDAPITGLYLAPDGAALVAVLPGSAGTASGPGGLSAQANARVLVTVDPNAATETGRTTLSGVTQLADGGSGRVGVADDQGVAFIDESTGQVRSTVPLDGPAMGLSATSDLGDNVMYASYLDKDGPHVATISGTTSATDSPKLGTTFVLPGTTAGWVFYDSAARMVHVLGSVPSTVGALGDSSGAGSPTVYVIEPHANAVYADARLPAAPAAIAIDDNQAYPTTDRQQLLAFSLSGEVAAVPIGRHALSWRIPGVLAGVVMAALLYVLARLLFRRRDMAVILGFLLFADGMLFVQSRIGMNDSYVGLGIVAAYTLFAAIWLRPGNRRIHWLAYALAVPVLGVLLGLALASKWVAAYAIGGLGILALSRSALGRLLLIAGLVLATTVLGYLAISVPVDAAGAPASGAANYLFLGIMVGLTLIAVIVNVLHPIAWTWEEERLTWAIPVVAGAAVIIVGLTLGNPTGSLHLGPIAASPVEIGFLGLVAGALVYSGWIVVGRLGFGPRALPPGPDDPARILEPPAPAPHSWLNLAAGYGLPAICLLFGLVAIPLAVYVISYIPWALIEGHVILPPQAPGSLLGSLFPQGWPPGNTGQTLVALTGQMYQYHNTLSVPHPASSPWWAWPFDLKPVWFYEQSFAGGTAASIYDAGNLIAWWLGIPAMAFVGWQAFARRSAPLALIAVGFVVQWISWARIDRAAFQYHYYTGLPFLLLALAYFLAELWNGASRRTWLLARVAAGLAIIAPFALWLLHRPLCGFVRVTDVNPGSQACPTLIPDLSLSPRALAIALVVGVGVLLLARVLSSLGADEPSGDAEADARGAESGGARRARIDDGLRSAAIIAVLTSIAFVIASVAFSNVALIDLTNVPVEPVALLVLIAVLPVAAFVAAARDARRFVAGALGAIGAWFVIWYPNIAALPLPANIHNAYQGFLPTYVYPFQFPVSTVNRNVQGPPLLAPFPIALLVVLTIVAIGVGYSAWTWRIALAERRSSASAASVEALSEP